MYAVEKTRGASHLTARRRSTLGLLQIMMVPSSCVCQITSRHWFSGVQGAFCHSFTSNTATDINRAVHSCPRCSQTLLHSIPLPCTSSASSLNVTQQQCVKVAKSISMTTSVWLTVRSMNLDHNRTRQKRRKLQ